MTDQKQNQQQAELRDLDVPAEQTERVRGGIIVTKASDAASTRFKPDPLPLNTFGGDDV